MLIGLKWLSQKKSRLQPNGLFDHNLDAKRLLYLLLFLIKPTSRGD